MTQSKTDSPYRTLADIRAKNASEGYHWFSRATMNFWKTRIESTLIKGRFFITSEDDWGDMFGGQKRRMYCVRYANDDGSIRTVRSHIRDKDDARELIAAIVKGGHARTDSGNRCVTCGEYREQCTGTL